MTLSMTIIKNRFNKICKIYWMPKCLNQWYTMQNKLLISDVHKPDTHQVPRKQEHSGMVASGLLQDRCLFRDVRDCYRRELPRHRCSLAESVRVCKKFSRKLLFSVLCQLWPVRPPDSAYDNIDIQTKIRFHAKVKLTYSTKAKVCNVIWH